MEGWQIELLHALERAGDENVIFALILEASVALDFNYCAYGLQTPYPLSNPKAIMLNNYPARWQERYKEARYLESDPTILLGRQSERVIIWSDQLYTQTPELWEEARGHGLRKGLSQSILNAGGTCAMLTLARSDGDISERELRHNGEQLRWLASTAHASLSSILTKRHRNAEAPELTEREREILKWTADGKSASEIADLLTVSKNTIDFHIKNAVRKLKTANKTAAVVRAAMLGLLF
ncbi:MULTISPECIES: autoinducer binding domain-containing protein [unclassified Pseudomonas]|uniref:autoinducer binding domain-containing protein n=1 Tax=unclassified Pseudomonas TaxID=196821 RepID=UPI002448060E|nr:MULTISPECIES: autoinducer binding domain-containing protein [unclassified Pseudomonas]MDH0304186.1 autoinducer binding domain-containing protein [Pseudomonas sp. GD04091]MDH1986211.1 autoinducer binding domain-containing protein [Pseudomonas sp. GD03689]